MSDKKVPEEFFKNLPDKILKKIVAVDIQEQLSSDSVVFSSISKQNPYSVPTQYFNNLKELNFKRPKTRMLWQTIATLAACTVIMIMVIAYDNESTNQFTGSEIIDYYVDNIQEVNNDMLSELLMDNDLDLVDEEIDVIINRLSDYELELLNQTY